MLIFTLSDDILNHILWSYLNLNDIINCIKSSPLLDVFTEYQKEILKNCMLEEEYCIIHNEFKSFKRLYIEYVINNRRNELFNYSYSQYIKKITNLSFYYNSIDIFMFLYTEYGDDLFRSYLRISFININYMIINNDDMTLIELLFGKFMKIPTLRINQQIKQINKLRDLACQKNIVSILLYVYDELLDLTPNRKLMNLKIAIEYNSIDVVRWLLTKKSNNSRIINYNAKSCITHCLKYSNSTELFDLILNDLYGNNNCNCSIKNLKSTKFINDLIIDIIKYNNYNLLLQIINITQWKEIILNINWDKLSKKLILLKSSNIKYYIINKEQFKIHSDTIELLITFYKEHNINIIDYINFINIPNYFNQDKYISDLNNNKILNIDVLSNSNIFNTEYIQNIFDNCCVNNKIDIIQTLTSKKPNIIQITDTLIYKCLKQSNLEIIKIIHTIKPFTIKNIAKYNFIKFCIINNNFKVAKWLYSLGTYETFITQLNSLRNKYSNYNNVNISVKIWLYELYIKHNFYIDSYSYILEQKLNLKDVYEYIINL